MRIASPMVLYRVCMAQYAGVTMISQISLKMTWSVAYSVLAVSWLISSPMSNSNFCEALNNKTEQPVKHVYLSQP